MMLATQLEAGRTSFVHQRDRRLGELGQRRDGRPQVGGQAAQLGGLDQQPQLGDEREAGVDRRAGGLDAGHAALRASWRSGGKAALSALKAGIAARQRPRQLDERLLQGGC